MNGFPAIFLFLTGISSPGMGGDSVKSVPSVEEYFPEIGGNLTEVVWAHAVNSRSGLEKALLDSRVMMMEADVVLGTIEGQGSEVIPIMAHPPANTSDLSLRNFLEIVMDSQRDKRKGVKLDFKSTQSFQSSWDVIDSVKTKIEFPFFLNADILSGPVKSETKPVDPEVFLKLSSTKFSESTLSLGWTTRYAQGLEGSYTREQLDSMKSAITNNGIKQPVTLCLRAGIAAQSLGIKDLVEAIDEYQQSNKTSVTIWMSTDSDPVDVTKLKELILDLRENRVYLDVPKFIRDDLALD